MPASLLPSPVAVADAVALDRQRNTELFQALTNALAAAELPSPQLGLLLDLLPEGVVLLDAEGRIEALNQQFFRLCGLLDVPAAWLGRAVEELLARVQAQVLEPTNFLLRAVLYHRPDAPETANDQTVLRDGRILTCDVLAEPAAAGLPRRLLCQQL